MAVPAGGDVAVYNSAVKRAEVRVAVGLDYPALTAQKQDLFGTGAAPNAADWWFTQLGGDVLVSGGSLHIRSKGGPSYEIARTREHWFPANPNQPWECEFNATFPQTDPVYTPIITLGSIEQTAGADLWEPLQIQHRGSATEEALFGGAADTGQVMLFGVGAERYSFANDQASHQYIVQWDPALAVNANKLTVKVDGVTRFTSDAASPPRYLAFGWSWSTLVNPQTSAAIAALADTQTLIEVHDVTVRQLATLGYESRTYPAWTSPNAGGTTLDNAAPGERFTMDGETWAKLPNGHIKSVDVQRGRSLLADTFTVLLSVPDPAAPDVQQNAFAGARWAERPVLIDTRVSSESAAAAWKRQMAGRIKRAHPRSGLEGATVEVSGRSEVMDKLDAFMSRAYAGEGALGEIEAVNSGYNLGAILGDLVDVSDKIAGSPLGATDRQIRALDIIPNFIGTGGQSLLPTFAELIDRAAYEYVVKFATSGTGRYGLLCVNAWTVGAGVGGYTFRGKGASVAPNVVETDLEEDALAGPGQVSYRQNLPVVDGNSLVNTFKVPSAATFPTFPYPAKGRVLSDSIAFAKSVQATAVQVLKDKDDASISGGVAAHRFRLENARRRVLNVRCLSQDWIEPTDEIALDDPLGTGVTAAESWVVDAVRLHFAEAVLSMTVTALTADWATAIERAR